MVGEALTGEQKKYLAAACEAHGETEEGLMAFRFYADHFAIVISTGQKFTYAYTDLLPKGLGRDALTPTLSSTGSGARKLRSRRRR